MICATSEVTWITAFWMLRLHIHLVNLLLTEYLIIIILFRLWNLHFWSPSVDEGVTDQELCLGSFTCNEITHIIMQIFFFFFFQQNTIETSLLSLSVQILTQNIEVWVNFCWDPQYILCLIYLFKGKFCLSLLKQTKVM